MPLDNTLYEFSAITQRPPFRWPNGERLAVWVCYNIEHFKIDVPSTAQAEGWAHLKPDVINYAWRDYGLRVGIWRNFEMMERLGQLAGRNRVEWQHETPTPTAAGCEVGRGGGYGHYLARVVCQLLADARFLCLSRDGRTGARYGSCFAISGRGEGRPISWAATLA